MFKTALHAEKIYGLIFDGSIFFGNIALFGFLPRLGDDVDASTAGFLLVLTWIQVLVAMVPVLWLVFIG